MRKLLNQFSRSQIQAFAIAYSKVPVLDSCAKEFGISDYMAKQLLYKAISECIVENSVVNVIVNTAYSHAERHVQNGISTAVLSAKQKYNTLKALRKTFMLSDEEGIKLVQNYACSPLSKVKFCMENALTCALFDRTMIYVISNYLVSDDIVDTLYEKALYFCSNEIIVDELFGKLSKARKRFQALHS